MMHRLSVVHPRLTVEVCTDEDGILVMVPLSIERFCGQPMAHLFRWLRTLGPGLEVDELWEVDEQ